MALIITIYYSERLLNLINSRQPDWFKESENELKIYLIAKTDAYKTWLSSSERDMMKFRQARYKARRPIRSTKNGWFEAKAIQLEEKHSGGKKV